MTLQKDISKNSKTRLEALRKEFRRRSEERKKSGKSLKGIPSLTLRNQDGKGKVLRFSHQLKKSKKKKSSPHPQRLLRVREKIRQIN